MPDVVFYLLKEASPNVVLTTACRIAEKAYRKGHTLHIHTANEREAHKIDKLLWTYRDISFLPHDILGETSTDTPITIGYGALTPESDDILMNLDSAIPSFYQPFNRLIEIVCNDPQQKAHCREHYKWYQQHGCELTTHQL